jgi:hypothetical protein
MPIVLLTDYGNSDGYAGILKGVIARISPPCPVIDLTHEIAPFDIIQGGFVLYQSYRYFPRQTIFVAVVDPGVGGERKPLLIQTENYYFIGPDNGLFTLVLHTEKIERIVHLTNQKYFLKSPSSTFHGRDIFASVAAHLANGTVLENFGEEIETYQRLPEFSPRLSRKEIVGTVISVDRFGNVVTNLTRVLLAERFLDLEFSLKVGKRLVKEIKTHYAEGPPKKPFLLFGSSNLLEISVNQGSAAEVLGIQRGDEVKIKL